MFLYISGEMWSIGLAGVPYTYWPSPSPPPPFAPPRPPLLHHAIRCVASSFLNKRVIECPCDAPAGTLLAMIVFRVSAPDVERQAWWFAPVGAAVPLVLAVVPGALGYYGLTGAW